MKALVFIAAVALSAPASADVYIPLTARHINATSELNEQNFGIGYGQDGMFAACFKDSLGKPSWMAGATKEWSDGPFGVGVAAFAMTRANIHHYRPFLGALPYVSVKHEGVSLLATYLPKAGVNDTAAVFFMLRLETK